MNYWGGQRVCWPPLSNYWGAWPPLAPPLPTPMIISLQFPMDLVYLFTLLTAEYLGRCIGFTCISFCIIIHRRRKRGGQGGPGPPNNLRGGPTYPLAPPNNPPICTGKTIPLNSILEFSIISYFKTRNVIIWH